MEIPSEIFYHFKAAEVSDSVVIPYAWLEFRKYYIVIMEKPENSTDLFEYSKENGRFTEEASFKIVSQLIR